MSNVLVPARPPQTLAPGVASLNVRCGVAVSQRDWTWLANALAYARGRGGVQIPAFDPLRVVVAGATSTYTFKGYQRYPTIQRLWIVRAHRASMVGGESTVVTLKAPAGGTAQTYAIASTWARTGTMWLLEDGVTQAEGEVDLSLDIINGSASTSLVVDQILCVELPRVQIIGGGTEDGSDAETDRGGEPIFYGAAGESAGGVIDAYGSVIAQPTRPGLFVWGAPDASALTTASTTDVDLFQPAGTGTGNPKVRMGQASKGAYTATVKTVQLRARMKVSGAGVGGRILVTSRLGATGTITCTAGATSFAWYTATIDVDCDDMTTQDGRRSGASEEISVVWKNTGTAGTVSCAAFEVLNG